jgi:hypothetical protein
LRSNSPPRGSGEALVVTVFASNVGPRLTEGVVNGDPIATLSSDVGIGNFIERSAMKRFF